MQFFRLDEFERRVMTEDGPEERPSPGVHITRRRILELGLAGLAGVVATGCGVTGSGRKAQGEAPSGPLTVDQFVAQLRPEAMRLIHAEQPDEDTYLAAVSTLLASYEPGEPWSMRIPEKRGWGMNTAAYMPPVAVFDMELEPGAKIDLHDHRHYNGVLYCVRGSVRCRNFDIVPPEGEQLDIAGGEVPPKGEDFLIRETQDTTLTPGRFASLARDRDNIHEVEAGPEGGTLVDVFTYFRREARSYELEWDAAPVETGGKLYRAQWKS